mgnify:CR=1 FL=1
MALTDSRRVACLESSTVSGVLFLDDERLGDHVMQALFFLGKRNHEKANVQNQTRQYFAEKSDIRLSKRNPVSIQISHDQTYCGFAKGCLLF